MTNNNGQIIIAVARELCAVCATVDNVFWVSDKV